MTVYQREGGASTPSSPEPWTDVGHHLPSKNHDSDGEVRAGAQGAAGTPVRLRAGEPEALRPARSHLQPHGSHHTGNQSPALPTSIWQDLSLSLAHV